jgi:Cytochrome c7 and related cytochrome c
VSHATIKYCWRVCVLIAAFAAACSDHSVARFPHQLHLAGIACGVPGKPACLTCTSCHSQAARGAAPSLPPLSRCASCHHGEPSRLRAEISAPIEHPYGSIAFDHDRHLALKSVAGQCVSCHAGVVEAGGPRLPPMAKCVGCHEHEEQWNRGQCAPCHALAEVRRVLPQTFLRHEGDFMQHHGAAAVEQKQLCQACHAQADCEGCHDASQDLSVERRQPEAVQKNFVHRGDFLTTHAIEAQSQPARCLRCHTTDTCDSCHLARGVSGGLVEGRNPHPPGWVGNNAGARSFHGAAARRDILLCASCHDQGPATNCIRCHKVGAYGGNPHPGGWKSTRSESSQMCRYCHG